MRELTSQEYKEKILSLMVAFDEFCRKNNLKYYLIYGSALGAIRHHGLIPWDDDIDIAMPLSSYYRLMKLSNECNHFRFCCYENTKGYFYHYGKVFDQNTQLFNTYMKNAEWQGAFLDVFPIENDYSGKSKIRIQKKLRFYNEMIKLTGFKRYWPSKNPIKNVIKYFTYAYANILRNSFWQKRRKKYIKKLNIKKSSERYILYDLVLEKDFFREGIDIDFDGKRFIVPTEYDTLLTFWYGDYMLLPKKEDRISNHDFRCYTED